MRLAMALLLCFGGCQTILYADPEAQTQGQERIGQ